jgi:hypothetical protein
LLFFEISGFLGMITRIISDETVYQTMNKKLSDYLVFKDYRANSYAIFADMAKAAVSSQKRKNCRFRKDMTGE